MTQYLGVNVSRERSAATQNTRTATRWAHKGVEVHQGGILEGGEGGWVGGGVR